MFTEDFLKNYGYAALGWFSKGIPFAFESQRARDIVPSNYGQWVNAPVNGYSKIFNPLQSCSADKIIIVGKPSGITTRLIEQYDEIREKQINLCDITSNMRAFNFEPLRPEDPKENIQTMSVDPQSNMDLCRSANSGSKNTGKV